MTPRHFRPDEVDALIPRLASVVENAMERLGQASELQRRDLVAARGLDGLQLTGSGMFHGHGGDSLATDEHQPPTAGLPLIV